MRIVGGTLRGRVFAAPKGTATRPTADRTREAIFNIIAHHDFGKRDPLKKAVVLDAFCGSGAFAFEALSRGAAHATLFDHDSSVIDLAEENAEKLGLQSACKVMQVEAASPPKAKQACHVIFLDPPYRKGLIETAFPALQKNGWIAPKALLVCETARNEKIALDDVELKLERTYGDTKVAFFDCCLGRKS